MTEEQLINIQNIFFEAAKTHLLEKDHAYQLGYVIADAGCEENLLDDKGLYKLELLGRNQEPPKDGYPGYSVMVLDMEPSDAVLLKQVANMVPGLNDPLEAVIDMGVEVFKMSREVAITKALNIFLKQNGFLRKDIVAYMVKEVCKATKAFAFIHVSEAYFLNYDDADEAKSHHGSLADDERSTEGLMSSMECHNFRRMMVALINREPSAEGAPRDSGKVIAVQTPPTESIVRDDGEKLTGRFMHVLQPVG